MYIDESGDEGPPNDDIHSQWFTTAGIIVDDDDKYLFEHAHDLIIKKYFTGKGIVLPDNFRLHYWELRENKEPYSHLGDKRRRVADDVFAAIRNINCSLISASINKTNHYQKQDDPFNVRAYTLQACRQRFQFFLEEHNGRGRIIYERFTNAQRRKIMPEIKLIEKRVAKHFPPNLYKIKSLIETGDPLGEIVLQFADFFAYAPHIRLVSKKEKGDRFDEIKHKYFDYDGTWRKRGFVVID